MVNNKIINYRQKYSKINNIQVQNQLYISQNQVHIFIYTEFTKQASIDLQVENVDVNSFALFGFNMQMQVVTESIINVTIKFEVLSGALICITCDVHVTSSSLIFSGVGLKMSGVVLESLNNIILEFSFVQFRLSSANTSGIVNTVKQHLAGFSITDCKLSGSSLVVSSNNGYLCSNALVPVTLSIQVLLVCVDQMERTGAHSQAIASVELEQISCGICGSMLVVYGLCTDGLEHAMEVNGMYKCVHPFEFVDDKCVCAYGYLLNLTACVNIVITLTGVESTIQNSLLQSQNNYNLVAADITYLNQSLQSGMQNIVANLIQNSSNLESYIVGNHTQSMNGLSSSVSILDKRIFDNITLTVNYLKQNSSNLELYIIDNASQIENHLLQNTSNLQTQISTNTANIVNMLVLNSSNIEQYIKLNFTSAEQNLLQNTSTLDQRIYANVSSLSNLLKTNASQLEQYIISNTSQTNGFIVSNVSTLNSLISNSYTTINSNLLSKIFIMNGTISSLNTMIQYQKCVIEDLQTKINCGSHAPLDGHCLQVVCDI
ncbi:protein_MON2 homolog [Hexamita inflata]|uniref:Protein MON2 homolog n=1 Tax=Hexamita inflata TaxID=28002 RepID=A0AA86N7Q5_9EUKA|nr:protein MON2 homolog [Hexamita inflata]